GGLAAERGAVTRLQLRAVGRDLPAGDVQPRVASGRERMTHSLCGLEERGPQIGVLVDRDGAAAPIARRDEPQDAAARLGLETLFLVARRESALTREEPDLEQVDELLPRGVELAVRHPGAGAHPLDVARPDHGAIAHAVLVFERSLEHPGENLHVAM